MELLPKHLARSTTPAGEAHVRALLTRVFPGEPGVAFHSVNLPEHDYKRYGEADFVLVRKQAITVLEVKGGTVSCRNGVWEFHNGRGQKRSKAEAPNRQAQSAEWAVARLLKGAHLPEPPVMGHAVVFPFTDWPRGRHPELPDVLVLDRTDCASAERFGARIVEIETYWAARSTSSGRVANAIDVQAYADAIRPAFHAVECLSAVGSAVMNDAARLTLEQIRVLDAIETNPRIILEGPAGTGKTLLSVAWANAASQSGDRTFVVAPTEALRTLFRQACPGVDVLSPDELRRLPSAGMYSCGVVDEGQCVATADFLSCFGAALLGGLDQGRWRWSMDRINQLEQPISEDLLDALRRSAMTCHLGTNVRSARPIVDQVKVVLGADIQVGHGIHHGIAPRFDDIPSSRMAEATAELVQRWMEHGLRPTDIAVLSTRHAIPSLAATIPCVQPGLGIWRDRTGVLVTDPATFRGLESPWIVVALDDPSPDGAPIHRWLYLAMTRARVGLAMLIGDKARAEIERLERLNFLRFSS